MADGTIAGSIGSIQRCEVAGGLAGRILLTLHLADRRGYGLSLDHLSKILVCGEAPQESVRAELSAMAEVSYSGAIYCLKGRERLLSETKYRLLCNGLVGKKYDALARQFAGEYASLVPFIRCIAVAGSVASEGFSEEDDIDFNIFVEQGCKYTVYLLGILLSLKYAIRHRRKPLARKSATPLLSKLICINVIWEDKEARPYERQDTYMAYELLRQRPVFGLEFYRQILEENRWLEVYFPQIYRLPPEEVEVKKTLLSRLLRLFYSSGGASRIGERICRDVSYLLWRFVQYSRRNNPEAMQRVRWVTEMQRPYSLFVLGSSSDRV